jgi:ribosomal protein L11 methyltransferase
MDLKTELVAILRELGPKLVWRPVHDDRGELLSDGVADFRDGRPEDISRVDFKGRTVIDLGCNLGFYSFLARQLGADQVLGVDWNEKVIRGAQLIGRIHGVGGVSFECVNFIDQGVAGQFDISLLIDFIGKENLREGIHRVLSTIAGLTRRQMIISARPYYSINKHLQGDLTGLRSLYPESYMHGDSFHVLDFVRDYFRDDWDMTVVSPEDDYYSVKRTLMFTRK